MKQQIFFVSDRTGLTVETLAKSLLAQFKSVDYQVEKFSFIDNQDKAQKLADIIVNRQTNQNNKIVVFTTLVDTTTQKIIAATDACVIDLFNTFIEPLEIAFGKDSAHTLGLSHEVLGNSRYQKHLDAIEFAMAHDDGIRPDHYDQADVVLVGVSRSGKTPTSLYLAMNFSLKASNYPLTDNELNAETLPAHLLAHKEKLVGLTIRPDVLQAIRQKRRPGGDYASLSVCKKEVKAAEQMFQYADLPVFNMTNTSIEETSGNIIKRLKLL